MPIVPTWHDDARSVVPGLWSVYIVPAWHGTTKLSCHQLLDKELHGGGLMIRFGLVHKHLVPLYIYLYLE